MPLPEPHLETERVLLEVYAEAFAAPKVTMKIMMINAIESLAFMCSTDFAVLPALGSCTLIGDDSLIDEDHCLQR